MHVVSNHRLRTIVVIVGLALASLFPLYVASRHTLFLNDDSYITLTYAKNLVAGNGFVFNHPPHTLGTTSPLFTLAVAALGLIFSHQAISTIAVYLTALCWLGIVWVFFGYRSAWGLSEWQAGLIGLIVIASGWVNFLGMEAYIFTFLLVLGISLFLHGDRLAAGFTLGLLFLTRGEGIIVFGLILLLAAIQGWTTRRGSGSSWIKPALMLGLGFAVPVAIWAVYAQSTFGSILPNTLAAKQAQGQNGLGRPFLERLVREWMPTWGTRFRLPSQPLINAWWLLILAGAISAGLRRRSWLIFLAWGLLYVLGYTVLGVSAYWWYQLPILFVLNLFFALGVIACVELIVKLVQRPPAATALSGLLVGAILLNLGLPTIRNALTYEGDPRGKSYIELSQWIRQHTARTDSVAFIEIGYLGYFTDNRIIDLAGLTLPNIVPHIAEGDFAWGFWHYAPDYYVHSVDFDWALADIRNDPRFAETYQPVATLHGPTEHEFVVYKRVPQNASESSARRECMLSAQVRLDPCRL
jgi:arabinofuranosyltransferase